MGEVTLHRAGFIEPTARVELDAEGRFHAEVPPGAYTIVVAAVDHHAAQRETIVSGDLRVEGSLGTYARAEPGETLAIRSELLDAKREVIGDGPREAKRISEGVYRIELGERPPTATRLRYQLQTVARTYNGPTADSYKSDGNGDYWSIVELGDRTGIDLDLGKLPPAGLAAKLEWHGEAEVTRTLQAFLDRWGGKVRAVYETLPRVDGRILQPTPESRVTVAAFIAEANAEIEATKDDRTRRLLRAAHISIFAPFDDDEVARSIEHMKWIVDELPPDDVHLTFLPNFDHVFYRGLASTDAELVAKAEAWLDQRVRSNPEPSNGITALAILIDRADERRDAARVRELYARAMEPRYSDTWYRHFIKEQHDPDRPLQRGKPLPAFEFAALEGDGKVLSSDREGKLYLIEFWSTWCGPCIADMPKLHDVYAAVNGAKAKRSKDGTKRRLAAVRDPRVEFVFVSFDTAPKVVTEFRNEHWSMPWTHAFVGNDGSDREVMKKFGFSGIPTAILVDERGQILEVGAPLRGDQLLATLERVLAERKRRSN